MLPALILVAALTPSAASAADAVTLRDGKVVLGQWVEPAPRGKVAMIVRRAWAETAMPDRLKAWQAAEAPWIKRARTERVARLEAWKREGAAGPVLSWIDSEVERLRDGADLPPLMVVAINRADVRKLDRRPPDAARKLRQAWRAGFADAEARPLADLASALEGRGFAMTDADPAPIDDLLPIPAESEPRWRARRAATEVAQERELRFIRYQGLVLPEGAPGAPLDASGALGGVVKSLLGEQPADDPLAAKGKAVAARGRVGMLVTKLDTAEDLSGVAVEIVLYARMNGDRWEPAASKTVRVRGDEVRPGEGGNVAADPQVQTVFKTIEGLGLAVPDDLKQKSLNIGAATQKALATARTLIQPELDALALPVDNAKP